MAVAAEFDNVSIVFGGCPKDALALMDRGLDRATIREQTGQVLGVHNCSLSVEEGETLVLMGLSGSGKSTLIRAANGLVPVVRGAVRLRDGAGMVDVAQADARTLRRLRQQNITMVFQQFGLLPWRTVMENTVLGLELAGVAQAERLKLGQEHLEKVGLTGWGHCKVSELSGGMQQRVGLARALATRAPILLMDEPFSALDPIIRTKLQDELLDLQRDLKRTIIFVSHDLDEAFKIGNRIAIMEGGRIVQCATPREIISSPANAYVSEFVSRMNPLDVLRARDLLRVGSPGDLASAPRIEGEATVREVLAILRTHDGPIAVTDGGKVIGSIDTQQALTKLLDPQSSG